MGKFAVTVDGQNYEVEAPNENTAWAWANQAHRAPKQSAADQIANDAITRGAKQNAAPIPSLVPLLEQVAKGGISPSPMGTMTNIAAKGANDLIERGSYEAGGRVTDFASARGASPAVAAGLGTVANLSVQAPLMAVGGAGGNMAGQAVAPAARSGAMGLMQSALKPTQRDLLAGKADRAAATMLDEGINATRGGMDRLRSLGEGLNRNAASEIARSPAQIGKAAVENRLRGTENTFRAQVNPVNDLRAIEDSSMEFLAHPQLTGSATMPVQLAQELKQGTYKQLKDKYGEMGNAATEAQKALARGLKEEIETAVPSVVKINEKASDIWNALNVAERRALLQGNNNPLGLAPLASNPLAAALFALDRSGHARSLLARGLNQTGKNAPAIGGVTGAAIGANAREGE